MEDHRFDDSDRQLLPTPGALGPPELTADDVQSVTRALLLLATTSDKINFETANSPPPAGSPAHRLWRGPESGYAIDGFLTMQYANMSATDHVRGFVALIRTPTVRSTALATIARGALESFARTWHLLARTSDDDFLYRVISLLRSDLRYSELLEEPVRTRDGDPVDPAARRAFFSRELMRMELPSPARIDLASMVAVMLDAEMKQDDGRSRYSALSSIAHAHRLGINTFITTDSNGQVSGLAAPRPVVMDIVGQLIAAMNGTTESSVAFYGDQVRHIELLETATQRALRIVLPIMESIWPGGEAASGTS